MVSIHSLKAANTVIDILKKYKRKTNNKYIFHWFTGSIAQLEKAIEIGCYFSINPGMLKTKSGLEIIKKVPLDRILVETDAPFALKVKNMDGINKELLFNFTPFIFRSFPFKKETCALRADH